MIKITCSDKKGKVQDITQLIQSINWSGDDRQCCRTLQFTILSNGNDPRIPGAECNLGDQVLFQKDDQLLFDGFIFTRQKATGSSLMDITCYDRGIYLKKNSASYKFTKKMPEAIVGIIAHEFQIKTGKIAQTGSPVSQNFFGSSLYEMIDKVYQMAGKKTGKEYQITFVGDELQVLEKEVLADKVPLIRPGGPLISASVTESLEDMINQVKIYNKNEQFLKPEVSNEEMIKAYGLMQAYLKEQEGEDNRALAQKMLEDNGVEQKISIDNFGNVQHISGRAVMLQEPYTGLEGLFFIDSDRHKWANGVYKNSLVLRFGKMKEGKR